MMIKYCIVDPALQRTHVAPFASIEDAQRAAGIVGHVDFGTAARRRGIIVAEFGLFEPVEMQSYFSIGPNLYAGGAVIFAYDEAGETIDYTGPLPIVFYHSAAEVEVAIEAEQRVLRPTMAVNGEVLWQWPQPRPEGMAR